jgi:hypothetical protein
VRSRSISGYSPSLAQDVPRPDPPAPVAPGDGGALLWDFLTTFLAARRAFLTIHRRYERRVISAARERDVSRDELALPPRDLWNLFSLRRLESLRDERLRPLKALGERAFGVEGHEELLDVYCTHLFHECSILAEEHRSVGRFVRIHDRRRYAQLFQEVSRFYPVRLRRMQRFFAAGLRRIEILLPEWVGHRVVVRSTYLFGERLARTTWGEGVEAFYRLMYPRGGAVEGYLEAGKSFSASGFRDQAVEALRRALAAADAPRRGRASRQVAEARRAAQALLMELGGALE